ncbi:spermidine/putrescine ABC transporter substrate-binding protein [Corallincola luteus]|uniref:Spermidine/putrescine ABC transporter substrate-binding protein n=1 Tax=Corallincola luteus TaxID=1775177 RepID=A0ABY2AL54_9GAMM|nr:spermidine/putrescine ABC transporter substrate-binding protein [Corallincola luteus]TCI03657.1 spermidine/putrescine ABC transporter substrate-binding protein [Corallincola luteus]
MIRLLRLLLIFAVVGWLPCATATATATAPLKLYNWEYYSSERLFNHYRQVSGREIHELYFESDEERDRVLFGGRRKEFDIAVIDNQSIESYAAARIIAPLSQRVAALVEKQVPAVFADACHNYGVPYLWGSLGIAYRRSKVSSAIDSWLDLLRPEQSLKGGIVMLPDATELLIPALKAAGYSINSNDPEQLRQAYLLLQQQKQGVLAYANPLDVVEQEEGKEKLVATMLYNGDLDTLIELTGHEDWQYVVPKEGSAVWTDCLAMLSGSEQEPAINQFFELLLTPQYAAWLSEDSGYATPVESAKSFLPKTLLDNTDIYLPADVREQSEYYGDVSASSDLRSRILLSVIR